MNKLEQAARQALDFCEELATLNGKYPYVNETQVVVDARKTSSALREALAEQEKPLYRKVLREMLDAHEQAEQEPVAWRCKHCNTDMPTEHASDCPVEVFGLNTASQHVKQEPVAIVVCNRFGVISLQRPDGGNFNLGKNVGMKFYAAPVRTKDLTDDEIASIRNLYASDLYFARAVIAADREKNK